MILYRLILFFIITSLTNVYSQENVNTVYFSRNSSKVNDFKEGFLNTLIKQIDSVSIDSIGIYGYSDYLGNKDYNLELSEKRAQNVFKKLKELNIEKLNFQLNQNSKIKGFGEIPSSIITPNGIPKDRKVNIIVYTKPKKHEIDITQKKRSFKAEIGMKFDTPYILEKVYFVGNKPDVIEASIPQLEDLYKQLKQLKINYKLEINGHICCLEEDATKEDRTFSRVLSTARALRVKEFLVEKGIPEDKIEYKGYSFDSPLVYPELSGEDRQKNRRIEVIVYR